jgi:hypothetical protein
MQLHVLSASSPAAISQSAIPSSVIQALGVLSGFGLCFDARTALANLCAWRLIGVFFREFMPFLAMRLAGVSVSCAALCRGIAHIVGLCAYREMLWVATQRLVAFVQNIFSGRYFTKGHAIGKAMRSLVLCFGPSSANVQMPIAFAVDSPGKEKAPIWLRRQSRQKVL